MEAIGTIYKNVRFRSRLEARWAVFFDEYGLKWEYEPETFKLNNGILYAPDFYLPDLKCYAEVKPNKVLNDIELLKLTDFEREIVLLIGFPDEYLWTYFDGEKTNDCYPFKYTDHWELCHIMVEYKHDSIGYDYAKAARTSREYDFFKFKKP